MQSFYFGIRLICGIILLTLSASGTIIAQTIAQTSQQYPELQASIFPSLTGNQLLDSLRAAYAPDVVYSYDTARDHLFSDVENNTGIVECIYTGKTVSIDPVESDPTGYAYTNYNFNTEHIYPQSKGASASPARSDLHHLRASYGNVNSSRGNLPFGVVESVHVNRWWKYDSVSQTYSSDTTPDGDLGLWSRTGTSAFQPRDNNKGDAARAVYYFYMMYASAANEADPAFFTGMMEDLLAFHDDDPIDATETTRNNRINTIQGNLNPFIVDTTLVRRAFYQDFDPDAGNETVTEVTIDFDNDSKSAYSAANITLDGISWTLDNTLIGSDANDMKNGLKSARGRVPASLTMNSDKEAGIGTISFVYARSNFSGDRTGTSPVFTVEVSTDNGATWSQKGANIDLAGVDDLTTFTVNVQEELDGRIRIQTVGGTTGKRFNIDDISVTDWPILSLATLTTPVASDVRYEQLEVSATITADGNSSITERGFVYADASLNNDPVIGGASVIKITAGTGSGSFSSTLTGLTAGTTYVIKPYAMNSTGTAYGEETTVSTAQHTLLSEGLTNGSLPAGWGQTSITFATSDGGYALFSSAASTLTTPAFDASNFTGIEIQMDVAKYNRGTDGPVTVEYTLNGGSTWTEAGTSGTPTSDTYLTNQIIFVPESSASMQVRFNRSDSDSQKRLRNIVVRGAHVASIGQAPERQNSGFRLLSTPVSTTLDTFLEPIWTQGATGADYAGGDPNVFQFDGTTYQPVTNLTTTTLNPGESIAVYLFELDEYGDESSNTWPKNLYTTGELTFDAVTPSLTNQAAGEYNLVGNPFETPIQLSGLSRGSVRNQVWVYDHAYNAGFDSGAGEGENNSGGGWRAWNGSIGSLSGGVIAPFQGFYIRNDASLEGTPSLSIPASAKTTGGQLYFDPKLYNVPGNEKWAQGPQGRGYHKLALDPHNRGYDHNAHDPNEMTALHLAARIQGQATADVWFGLMENEHETGQSGDVAALYPIDYAPFLMFYAVKAGQALDIADLLLPEDGTTEIELDLQAWQPHPDESIEQFVPLGGSMELIWNLPPHLAVTLEDRETGDVVDLQAIDMYELTHNPTSSELSSKGVSEESSEGFSKSSSGTSTTKQQTDDEKSSATLPYRREIRSPDINPNKTFPRFVLRVESIYTAVDPEPERPTAIRLEQNYPNPFNPSTTIRFALPRPAELMLELFDITGRRVAVLAEGRFRAGEHKVVWGGSDTASGVYLYRLRAGEVSITRSLTLIK